MPKSEAEIALDKLSARDRLSVRRWRSGQLVKDLRHITLLYLACAWLMLSEIRHDRGWFVAVDWILGGLLFIMFLLHLALWRTAKAQHRGYMKVTLPPEHRSLPVDDNQLWN